MPGVTEEQITAAKQMSAIEFLRRYRPGQLVKAESRGEFQLKEHDSFKINETTSLWHWKSRDVGGKSALDYLIKVEGLKFVEAVQTLCGENPSYVPPVSQPEQPKEFLLPPAAENNRRVFAYLLKRGIDRKVIEACIRAGILYESADYHNAVFVGKDETGTARYAFLRGTYTRGNPFKAEVSGSDKRFCFCLPPKRETKKLAIYEAAIEPLAHLTLEGTTDKWRLSLGGIYAPEEGTQTSRDMKNPIALDAFLARHPEIEEIEICTNNDFAGRWAANHIEKAYQSKYRMVRNLPEKEGCDYADLTKERYEKQLPGKGQPVPVKRKGDLMEKQRPKMELIGQDGNIFSILGRASRLLKENGQPDQAKEMCDRVYQSGDYYKALNIISEYVETELSEKTPSKQKKRSDPER